MFAARRRTAALGLATVVLLLGGCGLDQAASAQGIARNDLVSELAAQLAGSSSLTYAAEYRLPRGGRASVTQAQNPTRTSYRYPGGRLLVSDQAVTQCRGTTKPACATTPPPDGGALPATAYAGAQRTGMVAPATVVALLNAAALDAAVNVRPRDTTIAGRHATCVDLSGIDDERSREFSTCVTNDGVLGSFTGTLNGRTVDMTMTGYSAKVPAAAFDAPGAS